jgi:site-specific DNA recombinase
MWELAQTRLGELESRRRTVAANLGDMTYQQKRLALDALGVSAMIYRAGHEPRYQVEATIPMGDPAAIAFNTRWCTAHKENVTLRWTDRDCT